ncbi:MULTISPECIES: tetratricopeptide repeat protein [Chloracidobacterium]|jgi:tetratricopeptide (TPR) repeat protein|uniref:Tetratricopeptide repeat protein n=1 Tax=Chloracidobacterium thermophilum (strain B) TaxID=981222 RepID=G2LGL3_CHLTF|nr:MULTISPECIES: hypothetical protein [Chloracidobacterium]AEP11124.1 hypothetical protein Cabther_A0362 [Chloracidobacterium thermophilum B]QUV79040.1 hypothetical protein J8C08_01855 [Chloracidobacterium thermophilum]QUV82082.1 hypothetical protein J8C01_01775 [Chloracidobacterium sp. D]
MKTVKCVPMLLLAAGLLTAACGDAPRPVSSNAPAPAAGGYGAGTPAPTPPAGQPPASVPNAAPKYGDPVTDENFIKLLKPETLALVEKVRKCQKDYDAAPQNAALKRQLVAAKVEYGNALRDLGQAGPRIYYPAALRMYRQVLALDPDNKEALEKKKEIELIYQSMGRPIPD